MPKARANWMSEAGRRRWTEVEARAVLDALDASGEPVSVFAQRNAKDWRRNACIAGAAAFKRAVATSR